MIMADDVANQPAETNPKDVDPGLSGSGVIPIDNRSIKPMDAIGEAARKILLYQFEIMLKQSAKIRTKNQVDDKYHRTAVHDMRVAVRRMRSAIKLLGAYYKKDTALNRHRKTLKVLGVVLGNVRDMTVFIDDLDAFVKTLPTNTPASELDGGAQEDSNDSNDNHSQEWRDQLDTEWRQAEKALEKFLDSGRYANLVEDFRVFLMTPGAGSRSIEESQPYQVRHVLPPLIYQDYTTVRAYETSLDNASLNTLHALRIACKRLRYTLEFFTDVLGHEALQVIEATKAMQDYLGQIQDAQVHRELLEDYAKHVHNRQTLALLLKYLEASETVKNELRIDVPVAWEKFASDSVRRALAHAVEVL